MTKTLYDPEIEKRGRQEGIKQERTQIVKRMLKKGFRMEDIMEITGATIEEVDECTKV